MSDYSISSITSVRSLDVSAGLPQQAVVSPKGETVAVKPGAPVLAEAVGPKMPPPVQTEGAIPGRSVNPQAAEQAAPKPGAPVEPKPVRAEEKPALPISNGDSVTIHFKVDRKTNNITVFIVDRETKRVLRSIPPEELNKLKVGELLEMTA